MATMLRSLVGGRSLTLVCSPWCSPQAYSRILSARRIETCVCLCVCVRARACVWPRLATVPEKGAMRARCYFCYETEEI